MSRKYIIKDYPSPHRPAKEYLQDPNKWMNFFNCYSWALAAHYPMTKIYHYKTIETNGSGPTFKFERDAQDMRSSYRGNPISLFNSNHDS
jgi:hypothetical protein